jgi:hypothetical protein
MLAQWNTKSIPSGRSLFNWDGVHFIGAEPFYLGYARHGRVFNVFLHEPFFVDSPNRAILEDNRSIKAVSETFLGHFICNVNYLAWPDPRPFFSMF